VKPTAWKAVALVTPARIAWPPSPNEPLKIPAPATVVMIPVAAATLRNLALSAMNRLPEESSAIADG
jgi:hypothetical protein